MKRGLLEEKVKIYYNKIKTDGLFEHISDEKTAIITHPHPLYGGNMENSVVVLLQGELVKKGYSTLRFNFRQVTEPLSDKESVIDLKAAIFFLNEKGLKNNLLLAGYSYGSWINTSAISQGLNVADSIMISPPVAFLDYKNVKTLPCPGLVVTGTSDDIAPPELVKQSVAKWNPALNLKLIKGCDHFYRGYSQELKKIISDYL